MSRLPRSLLFFDIERGIRKLWTIRRYPHEKAILGTGKDVEARIQVKSLPFTLCLVENAPKLCKTFVVSNPST